MDFEAIQGLIAAPFTAMSDGCEIDLDPIAAQGDHLARSGVVGAFICGTTGEGVVLSVPERQAVARRWVEVAPEGFKVIVHAGDASVSDAKDLASHAEKIGAWGLGVRAPKSSQPTGVDDVVDYCGAVAAAASSLPFYYYHMPSVNAVTIKVIDFLRAADSVIPNLAGVKYTCEDLMDYNLCRIEQGGRFNILFGRDELMLCSLVLGACGAVGSTFNYVAALYHKLIAAFDAGDIEAAREYQLTSQRIIDAFVRAPGTPLGAQKTIMKMIGLDVGPARPPQQNLTDTEYDGLRARLEEIGLFEYCVDDS